MALTVAVSLAFSPAARHSHRTPTLRAVLQCIGVHECGRAYSRAAHSVCHPVPPLGGYLGPLLLAGRCSSPKGRRLLSPSCVHRWLSLVCWVEQGINAVVRVCRRSRAKLFCARAVLNSRAPHAAVKLSARENKDQSRLIIQRQECNVQTISVAGTAWP